LKTALRRIKKAGGVQFFPKELVTPAKFRLLVSKPDALATDFHRFLGRPGDSSAQCTKSFELIAFNYSFD
jgi:hypothetical protein